MRTTASSHADKLKERWSEIGRVNHSQSSLAEDHPLSPCLPLLAPPRHFQGCYSFLWSSAKYTVSFKLRLYYVGDFQIFSMLSYKKISVMFRTYLTITPQLKKIGGSLPHSTVLIQSRIMCETSKSLACYLTRKYRRCFTRI